MTEFTYFPDAQIDRVVGLLWQVAQEVHVTRQRTLALEELLVERGVIEAGALDAYQPSAEATARLEADGAELMERLIRTISETDDHRAPMRDQFTTQLETVRN